MKLYYAPVACSIAPHVALREAGLDFELVRVDFMRGKKLPDGSDFISVNPKGYVPAIVLDDGQLLTENATMLQYIADLAPEKNLVPKSGSFERVRLQEWLTFISTELHKGFGPFFSPKANDEYKAAAKERLASRLSLLEKHLEGKSWILGETFSVADGYMLYILRVWVGGYVKETLDAYPNLAAYHARIEERPAVRAALEAEGLLKQPAA